MYKIIGADQKEYGPIDTDQIRQWVSEGRVNGQTQACLEGTQEWKPLGMFPEFGSMAGSLAGNLPSAEIGPIPMEEILARDYTIDILGCVSRGWDLFMRNIGVLVIPALLLGIVAIAMFVAVLVVVAIAGLNRIPFAERQYVFAAVFLVANALVTYPTLGGFFYICLSAVRGHRTDIGDLFIGFKGIFADLFLAGLVMGLALSVCRIPYYITSAAKLGPVIDSMQTTHPPDPAIFSRWLSAQAGALPMLCVCMIPATYLSVNWIFTLPLIVDKQMGFWTAMKISWKIVHKHWFHVFGLAVLIGILNLLGYLFCCVGLLVTFPLGVTAIMFAYEEIFGRKSA